MKRGGVSTIPDFLFWTSATAQALIIGLFLYGASSCRPITGPMLMTALEAAAAVQRRLITLLPDNSTRTLPFLSSYFFVFFIILDTSF